MSVPTFDRDVRGHGWRACSACPHPTPGSCPSRLHRPLCDHVRADPTKWGPVVAAMPAETRPPRALPRGRGSMPCRPGDLAIAAHLNAFTGYGQLVIELATRMGTRGMRPLIRPLSRNDHFIPVPPPILDMVRDDTPGCPTLVVSNPGAPLGTGPAAILTMWESTRLSASDADNLRKADLVISPCRWFRGIVRDAGRDGPIEVVPLGIDPTVFRPGPPPAREGSVVRFGTAGRLSHGGIRKGVPDTIAAFLAAFPGRDDVRLDIKVWPDDEFSDPDDPRIAVDRRVLSGSELAGWYRSLDVYATGSRGEGFGLQPLQALACGTPVIAGRHTGHVEYLDDSCSWGFAFRAEPAGGIYAGCGDWFVPDAGSYAAAMRRAVGRPGERAAKGRAGADRAAGFTWDRTADLLVAALRRHGVIPGSPARERSTVARPAPLPTVDPTEGLMAKVRECRHWERGNTVPGCGCGTNFCKGLGVPVSPGECCACVESGGRP